MMAEMRFSAEFERNLRENPKFVVLDEADRLLDMGFRDDIEDILSALPPTKDRQMVMLSATFPSNVMEIAREHMKRDPTVVDLLHEIVPLKLKQTAAVVPVEQMAALLKHVLTAELDAPDARILVFFNTVRMTQFMSRLFSKLIDVSIIQMHSKLSPAERARGMKKFQERKKAVLFTSDGMYASNDVISLLTRVPI